MEHLPVETGAPTLEIQTSVARSTRVICAVWGEKYLDRLLQFTLPAALAPGNYPYLAAHLDCELNIVTERRLFTVLEDSEVIKKFKQLGGVRFTPIDDLLTPASYGLTLTLALARGFEDLGRDMVHHNLLFLNADFILADGSYRALLKKLDDGERLIMAPSYCAISERVVPVLREYCSGGAMSLAVNSRAMASLILKNLHSTVRGQIIDAPFHFDHVYIYQFYAQPDPHTLVGHQMPIAIVAMRPTSYVPALTTFWDWGAASEYCPDVQPCVIGDSDEFLMLELREQAEGQALLRLGSPDPKMIAQLLAPILTADQRSCATFRLTLHSRDLQGSVESARAAVSAFANEVLTQIGREPVPHRDHAQWKYHTALLREHRKQAVPRLATTAVAEVTRLYRKALVDRIERGAHRLIDDSLLNTSAGADEFLAGIDRQAAGDQLRQFVVDHALRLQMVEEIHNEICRDLEREIHEANSDLASDAPAEVIEPVALDALLYPGRPTVGLAGSLVRSAQYRIFGQVPFVSDRHPFGAIFAEPAEAIRDEIATANTVLVVGSAPGLVSLLLERGVNVSTLSTADAHRGRLAGRESFDFCYCELTAGDLQHLGTIYDNLISAMRPGGKIIALARSDGSHALPVTDPSIIHAIAAITGAPKIRYCEDEEVLDYRNRIEQQLAQARRAASFTRAYYVMTAMLSVAAAWVVNRRAKQRGIWTTLPRRAEHCAALLIDITR